MASSFHLLLTDLIRKILNSANIKDCLRLEVVTKRVQSATLETSMLPH